MVLIGRGDRKELGLQLTAPKLNRLLIGKMHVIKLMIFAMVVVVIKSRVNRKIMQLVLKTAIEGFLLAYFFLAMTLPTIGKQRQQRLILAIAILELINEKLLPEG